MEIQGESNLTSKGETCVTTPASESWVDVSKSMDTISDTNQNDKDKEKKENVNVNEERRNENKTDIENNGELINKHDHSVENNENNENNENIENNENNENEIVIDGNGINDIGSDTEDEVENKNENEKEKEIEKNLDKALSCKSKGNDFFKLKAYDEAIDEYTYAIELCPETTEQDKKHLSIFYANRAACYKAIDEYEAALQDCNISLDYNELYTKALWRRATINEKLEKYIDAQQDYKKILEIDSKSKLLVEPHIKRLQPKVDKQFEQQKEEVVGKLKTFANWGLGKLGLSLDNFEAKQDPNTGSYNIQFNPNPAQKGNHNP